MPSCLAGSLMFVTCCQEANRPKPDLMKDTRDNLLIQQRDLRHYIRRIDWWCRTRTPPLVKSWWTLITRTDNRNTKRFKGRLLMTRGQYHIVLRCNRGEALSCIYFSKLIDSHSLGEIYRDYPVQIIIADNKLSAPDVDRSNALKINRAIKRTLVYVMNLDL